MTKTNLIRPDCDGLLELHFKITNTENGPETVLYPNLLTKGKLTDEALDMVHGGIIAMLLDVLNHSKSKDTKEAVLRRIALMVNAEPEKSDETCH